MRAQDDPCADQDEQRDEYVARQVPPTADHRVEDDDQREHEQTHEHRLPQPAGPPEHGLERLRDVRVGARSGRSDHRGQPGDDRSGDEEEGIGRPPVPATGLARAQQSDVPAVAAFTQRGLSSPGRSDVTTAT